MLRLKGRMDGFVRTSLRMLYYWMLEAVYCLFNQSRLGEKSWHRYFSMLLSFISNSQILSEMFKFIYVFNFSNNFPKYSSGGPCLRYPVSAVCTDGSRGRGKTQIQSHLRAFVVDCVVTSASKSANSTQGPKTPRMATGRVLPS